MEKPVIKVEWVKEMLEMLVSNNNEQGNVMREMTGVIESFEAWEFEQKKLEWLKQSINLNQLVVLDESFRNFGKSTLVAEKALSTGRAMICPSSAIAGSLAARHQGLQVFTPRNVTESRGQFYHSTGFYVDDISLAELQELNRLHIRIIGGIVRK